MSTLADHVTVKRIDRKWLLARKTALVYLLVSVLCVVIDRVYALFGHGVYSAAMSWMFLYPLLGGVLPFSILWLRPSAHSHSFYSRTAYNSYNSGLATLTVASMLQGVFEIAGTSSKYLIWFRILGGLLVGIGLVRGLMNRFRSKTRLYHRS